MTKENKLIVFNAKEIGLDGTRLYDVAISKNLWEEVKKQHEQHDIRIDLDEIPDINGAYHEMEIFLETIQPLIEIENYEDADDADDDENIEYKSGIFNIEEWNNFVKFTYIGGVGMAINLQILPNFKGKIKVIHNIDDMLIEIFNNEVGE